MNHYYNSYGDKISKAVIDARCRKAKQKKLISQVDEFGYNFCEECGRSSGVYLDCSHNVSVNVAQKTRRCELAYDVNNITIRCRQCHQKHDKL